MYIACMNIPDSAPRVRKIKIYFNYRLALANSCTSSSNFRKTAISKIHRKRSTGVNQH